MLNWISLILMVVVLGWNIQGILEVGIDRASNKQWIITGIMALFVAFGIWRRISDQNNRY